MKKLLANIEFNTSFMVPALILLVAWCGGISYIALNVYRVVSYRPVDVVVTDKTMELVENRNRNRVTYDYRPVVAFTYTVEGQEYTGTRATPLDEDGTREWAEAMLDRFAVGGVYQAYYSPLNPADSYLIKRYSPDPFCFLLPVTLLLVFMGSAALFTGGGPSTYKPVRQADGWYAVDPPSGHPGLPPLWVLVGGFWYGLELLTLGPYFVLAFPDYDGWLIAGGLVYAALGAGLIYFFARDTGPPPDPVTPRVAFDTDQLVRGAQVGVRVEVQADYTMTISDVSLGLAEYKGHGVLSTPAEWISLAEEQQAGPGRPLVCTARITLPDDKERYTWNVVVRVRLGRREYVKTLPVHIQARSLLAAV